MATLKPLPYKLVEGVASDPRLAPIPISIEGLRELIESIVAESAPEGEGAA